MLQDQDSPKHTDRKYRGKRARRNARHSRNKAKKNDIRLRTIKRPLQRAASFVHIHPAVPTKLDFHRNRIVWIGLQIPLGCSIRSAA